MMDEVVNCFSVMNLFCEGIEEHFYAWGTIRMKLRNAEGQNCEGDSRSSYFRGKRHLLQRE